MNRVAFVLAALLSLNVFAAPKDPNIEQEGNKTTVKREACLLNGGSVGSDKRYAICNGGKYDGGITSGPDTKSASCASEILVARALLQADGTPKDEADTELYLYYSKTSLAICKGLAKNGKWTNLVKMIESGEKVCVEAQQGNSDIYLASCNLSVADIAARALGQ